MARKKLTAADWLIIITVILCVLAIFVRIFIIGNNYPSLGTEKLEIIFVSEEFDANMRSLFKTDDSFKLKNKAYIGKLSDGYSIISAKTYESDENGVINENAIDGAYILQGSVSSVGMTVQNGIYISGCGIISVGDTLILETDLYTVTVKVVGIKTHDSQSDNITDIETSETETVTDELTDKNTEAEQSIDE